MDNYKFPQVLLIGNGLNQAYGGDSWDVLLKNISVRKFPQELKSPMPLQAILLTNDNVDKSMKERKKELFGSIQCIAQAEQFQKILSIGFDHILTTNYSYELEMAAQEKNHYAISEYTLKRISENIQPHQRVEPKFLLHTYNRVLYKGITNCIWHIHGEARKPNSMILGHYYYANLLCKMKDCVDKRRNVYQKSQENGRVVSIQNWMDAFILGDIYILGFGYNLSEIDLWWLLNRKKRENAETGKVYFYMPQTPIFDEKVELLKIMGVEFCHCNILEPSNFRELDVIEKNKFFAAFYECALHDIEVRVSQSVDRV